MKRFAVILILGAAGVALAGTDPIEDYFAERGPFPTASSLAIGPGNEFSLFAPDPPGQGGSLHPVITWGNGTFGHPEDYFEFLDHLASHGFVVVASNSGFTGSGDEMIEGVDWILSLNEDPGSPFFGTIDADAVGATGHSQGGQGTVNAGSDPRVVCTAPIEGGWSNVTGLHGPMFAVAGENDTIVPARTIANGIFREAEVPSILGVLNGATHFEALGDAGRFRGYVTAWFATCLMQDPFARDAFAGACSLCQNPDWFVARKPGS